MWEIKYQSLGIEGILYILLRFKNPKDYTVLENYRTCGLQTIMLTLKMFLVQDSKFYFWYCAYPLPVYWWLFVLIPTPVCLLDLV